MIKSGADVRKICIQKSKENALRIYNRNLCLCRRQSCGIYASVRPGSKEIKVITPMGVSLTLPVIDIDIKEDKVICAIKKDSGDDPDVTNGIKIYAQVSYVKEDIMRTINTDGVIVDGGIGVGRVTKKGLKCAVGEAAINPVPLKMIKEAVAEAAESYSYEEALKL